MNASALGLASIVGLAASLASAQPQKMNPVLERQKDGILAPVIACFAPGTDPLYAQRVTALVNQYNAMRFGGDYQLNTRWSGAQGSPRALTWSLIPDGVSIPGGANGAGEPASNSNLFATFDAAFAAQGGRATWVNRVVQIFGRWQAVSGLTFTRITVGGNDWDDGAAFPGSGGLAGARGDLRIGGHPIDGANGILAYCFFPSTGDCVMDTNDTANFGSSANSNRFMRNTVGHEYGHGIGLNHVDPTNGTKLMEAFLNTGFDGPTQDDIRAAQRHYGDPYEANDTSATAKPIGALAVPGSLTFGTLPPPVTGTSDANAAQLSIDANGETDFWSFTVSAPATVGATATPVGSTYLQGPQGGATANVNALAIGDLSIAILSTDGATVLGSSSSAAVGLAETVSGVLLPAAGTYFVRVTEANTPAESQLYRLSLTAASTGPVCPSFTTQPVPTQSVCENGSVVMSVVATGSPVPTLQWRLNNNPIPGATSATLTVFPVSTSDAGTYTCVATNSCGPATSNGSVLTVNTAPAVTTQPVSQTIPLGQPVTFTVVATGTPTPTYQWRQDTTNIPGANGPSYTIPSVSAASAGDYDCVLINTCSLTTTDIATLTIGAGQVCYANCDGSSTAPILNALDFSCFLTKFAQNDTYANCDNSTTAPILNALDFSCFLTKFAAGCT